MFLDSILRILCLATILIIGAGTISGKTSLNDYFKLRDNHDLLLSVTENLQQETESLEQEIEKIRTSPSYAHRIMREKYQVLAKGEYVEYFAE